MWSRDLPEDLVVEILSRLPVKSLMRFKSVHKSWHALIRNHSFITQHHRWATSDNQGRGVVFTHKHQGQTHVALLSNDTLEMSRDIEMLSFFPENFYRLVIDGPCNGIFFLYGKSSECLYGEEIMQWNPATRESKLLPIIKQRSRYSGPYVAYNFGFGIDPKTNDLKVVRIVYFFQHKQPQFEVYNLSTDSWRVIDTPVRRLDYIFYPRFPSYLNGFYHWKARGYGITGRRDFHYFMLSFDMSNEVFQETQVPRVIKNSAGGEIAIINDSVSLIQRHFK